MKMHVQPIRSEELAEIRSMMFGGATLLAATFATWSLSSDLGISGEFAVHDGLLSKWIFWTAVAIAVRSAGKHLEREIVSRKNRRVVIPATAPVSHSTHTAAAI